MRAVSVVIAKLVSLLMAVGAGLLISALPLKRDLWDGAHTIQLVLGVFVFAAAVVISMVWA